MHFFIIFFLLFFFRILFILFYPDFGGDYDIYSTVAKNILRGCGVSLSDPLSNECIPHFGGNHGPGYDFFIATIWYITDNSNNAVRILQTFIYCIFCLYSIYTVSLFIKNKLFILFLGILFAFSPLLVAWPRYVQTETLAIAFTYFLIAELLISYKKKKVRVIQIGLALILATWVRLDNIF